MPDPISLICPICLVALRLEADITLEAEKLEQFDLIVLLTIQCWSCSWTQYQRLSVDDAIVDGYVTMAEFIDALASQEPGW